MNARGEVSEKQQVISDTEMALASARTLADFLELLEKKGHEVYYRNNMPCGVVGKRKYRFSSLGVSLDKFGLQKDRNEGRSMPHDR